MKAQIYFSNLKRAITGTLVGAKYAMDVNVVATSSSSGEVVKETRYHDCADTNIQNDAGSFVEIGTDVVPPAIANTITKIIASTTFGQPVAIRKAANAGAAALADDLILLNKGQTLEVPTNLIAGDKLWVRSKSSTGVSTGLLTLNLIG